MDTPKAVLHKTNVGDMAVSYTIIREEQDLSPFLKGLPNDQSQARHWGYILKGSIEVDYGNHRETCGEGELFYLPPGHVPHASPGTELIQFTPKNENEKTVEAIMKNVAEMSRG